MTKNSSSRGALLLVASAIIILVFGVIAIANADERGNRSDRPDKPEKARAFVNILAKVGIQAPVRVQIGENDRIQVHGATVTATSTAGFTATTSTPAMTFNVQTDASTKFQIRGEGRGSLVDIAVGDVVNFRGTVLSGTTTSTLTVKALVVEEKTPRAKPPKPPKPATTTVHAKATTTAQIQVEALMNVIARLQAIVDQMKIRFGL